ncbi:ABC transporter ATP-binding protein [Rhizohabitans arisaemae]|uniref:ABC transporter ATP-binding protein n=1 Tax=Rhizohabitans arisaemae TaxID=2720610 RepID=UPI0024B23076|nr:ABC transporter ATP-binding protein [Rhizohabitans arisaemae]
MSGETVVRMPGTGPADDPGPTALEATGLSKSYRRNEALRDCSLSVPAGRVVALVGPNGAGKSTFLKLVVGLLEPTEGSVKVLGEPLRPEPESMARVAFLAQDKPLYPGFTVAETLRFGRIANPRWDQDLATGRLEELGIPLNRKVGRLSGGQRTQVALTLAIAKRADLLVLDEPLADLDPLARHDVLRGLMVGVADTGVTVLFSSHVVSDLEGVCDWLVVLNGGRVQLNGDVDRLLAGHRRLTGPAEGAGPLAERFPVIARSGTERQDTLLVQATEPLLPPEWTAHPVGLEELVLAYLRRPDAAVAVPPILSSAR